MVYMAMHTTSVSMRQLMVGPYLDTHMTNQIDCIRYSSIEVFHHDFALWYTGNFP